ncbi:hypothetical protein BJX63DRAFT_381914 [Aspergillus granulosus]|uniref:Uncharacterized protein n=1 Tax=Aspergillus granulosus TaxID=176169 RepID=A0ABR4HV79_9EURO
MTHQMTSRISEVRMIILSDCCCARAGFFFQYVHEAWCDLRHYGPCLWDDFRKHTIIDNNVYLLAAVDESTFFIDDAAYFNARNSNPPDGYVLLYDVTSRESFEFAERAVGVLVEGLRKRPGAGAGAGARSGSNVPGKSKTGVQRGSRLSKSFPWVHDGHKKNPESRESTCSSSSFTLFPRLPLELQLAILRVCLTSSKPVLEKKPHLAGININILLVSKFLYDEGTKIYRTENRFLPPRPIYLVADTTWVETGERLRPLAVPEDEGQALADRYACVFHESSSRSLEDVKAVVDEFIRDVVERKGEQRVFVGLRGARRMSHIRWMAKSMAQRVSRVLDHGS